MRFGDEAKTEGNDYQRGQQKDQLDNPQSQQTCSGDSKQRNPNSAAAYGCDWRFSMICRAHDISLLSIGLVHISLALRAVRLRIPSSRFGLPEQIRKCRFQVRMTKHKT